MRMKSNHAIALAVAATVSAMTSGVLLAGDTVGAVTVSLSGSTAMRNFTTNTNSTALTPGTSVTIGGNVYTAAPVTTGPNVFPTVQLAHNNTLTADAYVSGAQTNKNFLALRVEWHEQGSVEGIVELANDQVAPIASLDPTSRNPVASPGNRIYVNNTNIFQTPGTINGFTISSSAYNTYTDYTQTGTNINGGQNRVQMAISDVRSSQGFSVAGTSAVNRTQTQAGYGKGNPALKIVSPTNLLGLGSSSVRRQLVDETALNMTTAKDDPNKLYSTITASASTKYDAGAWNTAGTKNLVDKTVAVTATTFAANPGTGLENLNRSDAQWLQTTGRLSNGADFNVVTRDINSGTLNVAAVNVGIDPSWAVGENDDGNGNVNPSPQTVVGTGIKFSGKTSGGGQLRPTVQVSRMAIGHLSLSDVRGGNLSTNSAANPLRALSYRDSLDDTAAPVEASFDTLTSNPGNGNGGRTYALFQNQTYVTVKDATNGAAKIAAWKALDPTNRNPLSNEQAWATMDDVATGIKGENGNAVRAYRENILGSATQFPLASSFLNPANGLITAGFVPEKFLYKIKPNGDGVGSTVTNASVDTTNYQTVRTSALGTFSVGVPSSVQQGTGSFYGGSLSGPGLKGNVAVTAKSFMFGDFDQNTGKVGVRDYSDLKSAVAAQTALRTAATGDLSILGTGGAANNTSVTVVGANLGAISKGEIITLGDFDSDGDFDGRDLYRMASGTSLADSGQSASNLTTGTASLSGTFADKVRATTGVQLYKNAALDYLNTNATAAQKAEASVDGGLAFNKFDINRDGVVTRKDLLIVDSFIGKSYTNLDDQLGAVIKTDNSAFTGGTNGVTVLDPTLAANDAIARKQFSLVDAELTDGGSTINSKFTNILRDDFNLLATNLLNGGVNPFGLTPGDVDLDGEVTSVDITIAVNSFGTLYDDALLGKWTEGDVDGDGEVTSADITAVINDFGGLADFSTALLAYEDLNLSQFGVGVDYPSQSFVVGVPEPTSLALLGVAAGMGLRRRRVK